MIFLFFKLNKIQERQLGATNRFSVQADLCTNTLKSIKKTRSTSFDGSSNNNLSNLIISKALVVQEFTPSPYDTNSLCLKVNRYKIEEKTRPVLNYKTLSSS